MKSRDQLAKDITCAIQSYITRYSGYNDIPEERKKDIQQMWLMLEERNPVKLRRRFERKLEQMPSGLLLFFMFDLKRLKIPLIEVLSQDRYQRERLQLSYESELSVSGDLLNREDILHLVDRVNQLESNVTKHEKRTQNLELEVSRLTKENSFLTDKIQELHEKNKQLEKEKKQAIKKADNAESKLQTMEEKYEQLMDENKKLKKQLESVPKNFSKKHEYFELQTRGNLSAYL